MIFVFVSLLSFTLPVELVLCLFSSCSIDNSLTAYGNYFSTLTTPFDSLDLLPTDDLNTIHVMNKYVPLKGRVHIGYGCRKHGRKICHKKTSLYFSTCSDVGKRFYYCHGFSRISSATRTCFLEHKNSMSLGYG